MQHKTNLLAVPFLAVLFAVGGCDRASFGGDGHDQASAGHDESHAGHGHGEDDGLEPLSVTVFTPKVQLFMEYPQLYPGVHARFLAHVTVLATGQPVRWGTMTFELMPPTGQPVKLTLDAPNRAGLFIPEWEFTAPGRYKLQLSVDSPQVQETIDVGELIVHADIHAAEEAAEAAATSDPPDMVPFLLEQQWKIGTRYETVARRTLVHRLAIPGHIAAPQGASAVVSPPISGRLLRPPGGRLPRIGDAVKAGQVLALIEPQLSAAEMFQMRANRAQIQALETELSLRELDLDTKALEVERSVIQSTARLDFARRAMTRADKLREKGVGTDMRYDEAQQDLLLAQAEYEAAQAMRKSYGAARTRLANLRKQALPEAGETKPPGTVYRMPLVDPITGEIVSVVHIEGEQLDLAHEELFRIVNTEHVWVEADISEFDLRELGDNPGATMTLPAYPGRSFDILGSGKGRLVNIGCTVDPHTRTLSVVYEMPNPEGLFRVGMFANVFLETRTATEVVAIPDQAIVSDNGRPTAYVLIDGESFQRRELQLGIRDNGFVEVVAGIMQGERVVTDGSYAIKLASLAPASFGHGHGH